jgi:hypothetical protein
MPNGFCNGPGAHAAPAGAVKTHFVFKCFLSKFPAKSWFCPNSGDFSAFAPARAKQNPQALPDCFPEVLRGATPAPCSGLNRDSFCQNPDVI